MRKVTGPFGELRALLRRHHRIVRSIQHPEGPVVSNMHKTSSDQRDRIRVRFAIDPLATHHGCTRCLFTPDDRVGSVASEQTANSFPKRHDVPSRAGLRAELPWPLSHEAYQFYAAGLGASGKRSDEVIGNQ